MPRYDGTGRGLGKCTSNLNDQSHPGLGFGRGGRGRCFGGQNRGGGQGMRFRNRGGNNFAFSSSTSGIEKDNLIAHIDSLETELNKVKKYLKSMSSDNKKDTSEK